MENRSNHSATAPKTTSASQQDVNMTQSSNDNIATTPIDNSFSAMAAIGTIPVQSIDLLKETKEKADITKPSEHRVAAIQQVPSVKPSNIPILSSVINQKYSALASIEQIEIPAPTPIVAESIDSGFLKENADKLPSVPTIYPQQTVEQQMSSVAQFKAELTVKNSTPATDGVNNIDEAPQELSFHRTTSSAPNNSYSNSGNSQPATAFDGFAGKMNKLRDQMSNIFPAGIMGCRDTVAEATRSSTVDANSTESSSNSRRFMDAKEASLDCVGHIDSTPRKRPSSCKPSTGRNPLTGFGLDDANDSKRGFGRRKDGNPVLGVGYNAGSSEEAAKPSGRIPPGGHSTKLW